MTAPAATTAQLPRKFNPTTFQWVHAGKVIPLDTMSREDLMQVACECVVALERMESLQLAMAEVASDWRQGRITLDEEGADAAG